MTFSLITLQDAIDAVIPDSVGRSISENNAGNDVCLLTFNDAPAYQNPQGENTLSVFCTVMEDGEMLQVMTPYFFHAESSKQLQQIISKLYSNETLERLTRFWADPEDGEVRAILEVPIEDAEVDKTVIGSFISRYLVELIDAYGRVTGSTEKSLIPEERPAEEDQREKVLQQILQNFSLDEIIKAALGNDNDVTNDVTNEVSATVNAISVKDSSLELESDFAASAPSVIIRVSKSYKPGMTPPELYEICRGNWSLNIAHASKAALAYVAFKGKILEVYEISEWEETDQIAGNGKPRIRFNGKPSLDNRFQIGLGVKHLFKKGDVSPVKYLNIGED